MFTYFGICLGLLFIVITYIFYKMRNMLRAMKMFAYKLLEVTEAHNDNACNMANFIVLHLQEKATSKALTEEEQEIFHACRATINAYESHAKKDTSL